MRAHLEALFTLDGAGRLVSVNEPEGGPAPRFFLGRTDAGHVWAVRNDVGPALVAELAAAVESEPVGAIADDPECADLLAELVFREGPIRGRWSGPAYCFPHAGGPGLSEIGGDPSPSPLAPSGGGGVDGRSGARRITPANARLLQRYLPEWLPEARSGAPMAVSLEDGHAVSLCCSVRMTETAHEGGVETHPAFRGRGHATRCVAAWASLVQAEDRVPLYSTSWGNEASRSVARRLGLFRFGSDFHLT